MIEKERLQYIQTVLDLEMQTIGVSVRFPDLEFWQYRVLCNPEVDPTNVHKPYGILVPQLVNGEWSTAFYPPLLLEPVRDQTDDAMSEWLTYWLVHLGFHQIVRERVTRPGLNVPTLGELEDLVDQEFERLGSDLYHYGKAVALE